jgi:hypothetical protein
MKDVGDILPLQMELGLRGDIEPASEFTKAYVGVRTQRSLLNFFPFFVCLVLNAREFELYEHLLHSNVRLNFCVLGKDELVAFASVSHLIDEYISRFREEFPFPDSLLTFFRTCYRHKVRRPSVICCLNDSFGEIEDREHLVQLIGLGCSLLSDREVAAF